MRPPVISVIIPTYNRGRFVGEAIDSVLAQTRPADEVIVVDDGSTDDTATVLARYGTRLRTITQQNLGVSAARNAGTELATGDWIAFLDSDDTWLPQYLAVQCQGIIDHPEAILHQTNYSEPSDDGTASDRYSKNGMLERFEDSHHVEARPLRWVLDYRIGGFPSTVVKREVFAGLGGFAPGLSMLEDWDLMARLALAGPFHFVATPLVTIHRRRETIRHASYDHVRRSLRRYSTSCEVLRKVRQLAGLTPREANHIDTLLARNLRTLGNHRMTEGLARSARADYFESWQLDRDPRTAIKLLTSYLPLPLARLFSRRVLFEGG